MKWDDISPVALIVALIGVGGAGAFFREIADVFTKVKGGMSAREKNRKLDIIQERDREIARAEVEAANRRIAVEYAATLRLRLIEKDVQPEPWPEFEKTVTPAELKHLREQIEE